MPCCLWKMCATFSLLIYSLFTFPKIKSEIPASEKELMEQKTVLQTLISFYQRTLILGRCCRNRFSKETSFSIRLPYRSSLVTLQLGCFSASHRLATPTSVISLPSRYSLVTLQLGCFSASQHWQPTQFHP